MSTKSQWRLATAEYLLSVVMVVVIAVGFSHAFRVVAPPTKREVALGTALLTTVTFGGAGLIGLTILYLFMIRGMSLTTKIMVGSLLSPVGAMAMIIFGETLMLTVFKELPNFAITIIVLISIYVTLFSQALLMADALGQRAKNVMMIFYGSVFGAFLGLVMPVAVAVVVGLMIAAFDLLLVNRVFVAKLQTIRDQVYVGRFIQIGLGEFVFYAIPPALSYYSFGPIASAFSVAALMIGALLNIVILVRRGVVAGLTVPTVLGLIPVLALYLVG